MGLVQKVAAKDFNKHYTANVHLHNIYQWLHKIKNRAFT